MLAIAPAPTSQTTTNTDMNNPRITPNRPHICTAASRHALPVAHLPAPTPAPQRPIHHTGTLSLIPTALDKRKRHGADGAKRTARTAVPTTAFTRNNRRVRVVTCTCTCAPPQADDGHLSLREAPPDEHLHRRHSCHLHHRR